MIVLYVRNLDEFEKKHIPKAVLLPLEELREGNFPPCPIHDYPETSPKMPDQPAQNSLSVLRGELAELWREV